MNSRSRQQRSRLLLGLLMLAMGSALAFVSWQSANASARRLGEAKEELSEATRLTADIRRLKNAPRIASLEIESPDEISNRVTASLRSLKSPTATLQRLDPQQPVRIPKTEYQIRETEVELDNIQLTELARFSADLIRSGQGLEVRDIVLSEPETANKSRETWLARLTLTQIIYSPQ